MREALMEGGRATGTIRFNHVPEPHESGTAFLRQAPGGGDWHWYVEGARGSDASYKVALDDLQDAMYRRGITVPELAEFGSTASNVTRYLLGAAAVLLMAAMLAFAFSLTSCTGSDSREMKPAPQTHRWLGYPLEVHISSSLDLTHRASIVAALNWAETRLESRRFNVTIVPQDTLSVMGTPPHRVVEFSSELPSKPRSEVLAHTEVFKLNGYAEEDGVFIAHSAQVRSYTPSVSAYVHEVLHVLGLGHGVGTLMDVQHGRDQNGKGGDIDNMTLLPAEIEALRL